MREPKKRKKEKTIETRYSRRRRKAETRRKKAEKMDGGVSLESGWADRGGITFLLLSIDRSSYRSTLLLLLHFFLPPASSSLACFELFLLSNGGTRSSRLRSDVGFSPTISRGAAYRLFYRPVIDRNAKKNGGRGPRAWGMDQLWEEMKWFLLVVHSFLGKEVNVTALFSTGRRRVTRKRYSLLRRNAYRKRFFNRRWIIGVER